MGRAELKKRIKETEMNMRFRSAGPPTSIPRSPKDQRRSSMLSALSHLKAPVAARLKLNKKGQGVAER